MSIEIVPVKIEAYEDGNEPCFKVEAFDECCANVTISTLVDPKSWPEVSEAIAKALLMMFPEEK